MICGLSIKIIIVCLYATQLCLFMPASKSHPTCDTTPKSVFKNDLAFGHFKSDFRVIAVANLCYYLFLTELFLCLLTNILHCSAKSSTR